MKFDTIQRILIGINQTKIRLQRAQLNLIKDFKKNTESYQIKYHKKKPMEPYIRLESQETSKHGFNTCYHETLK